MSFHLAYNLLLLQLILGCPPFEHKSPGLARLLSSKQPLLAVNVMVGMYNIESNDIELC